MSRIKGLSFLKRDLDQLMKFLSHSYDINNGGCCYIASIIAKELESLGVSYKLVIYSTKSSNMNLYKSIKDRDSKSFGVGKNVCNHYAIKIDDVGVINEGGFRELTQYEVSSLNSTDIRWIYRYGRWNDTYNKIFNTVVKSFIHSTFKAYELKKEFC